MTGLNQKIEQPARMNLPRTGLQGAASTLDGRAREMTHREDYARNGDYLGRQPGDISGRNHFDEEYFVDEHENDAEAEMAKLK